MPCARKSPRGCLCGLPDACLSFPYSNVRLPSSPNRPASNMSSTTKLFLSPAPGTVIKPTYEYDEEQKEKLQTLREVCPL